MKTLTHQSWPIAKFIEYDKNPRKNDHAVDQIAAAIEYFGFRVPIVAKSDGTVVDGHLRLKAARKLGMIKVPVVLADDMTDEQIRGFRISVNRMSELADWDEDLLRAELLDLQGIEFDMDLLGFDVETLEDLLFIEPERDDSKEDEVPEPPADPVSQLGDVWLLGRHRVMCGDSTKIENVEKLMDGKKADLLLTDPPYNKGSENTGFASNSNNKQMKVLMESTWDQNFDIDKVLKVIDRFLKDDSTAYLFTSHHLAPFIWQWMKEWSSHYSWCVWSKPNPMPSLSKRHWTLNSELICYATKGKHIFNFPDQGHALSTWTFTKCGKCDLHPTMKPVSVMEHAILHSSNKEQLMLDCFLGSGTTLIAAEKTNRICFGLEISPAYVDVIINRWQTYTNQQATLEATGQTFDEICRGGFIRPAANKFAPTDG